MVCAVKIRSATAFWSFFVWGELAGDCDKASGDFAFVIKATRAGALGAADDDAAALKAGARPDGG
eukprot:8169552-Alexandrium_andersonii.AAC.1